MRPLALPRDGDHAPALGAVLAHDLHRPDGRKLLRKGQLLTAADLRTLAEARETELHVLLLDPGDIHEARAARRLAASIAGAGVRSEEPRQGRVRLSATARGLLEVDAPALAGLNAIEHVAIYTLFTGQVVDAGTHVAEAKVIPLVVPGATIEQAEQQAWHAGGVVAVHAFRQLRVGVVVREVREGRGERFRESIGRRLAWYGGEVTSLVNVGEHAEEIAAMLRQLADERCELILMAGGAFADPLDPALLALPLAGARMERAGLPAHPGSMSWLAYLGQLPIVGLASCGWFSECTAADLLLARLFAGLYPTSADLAALGHGGMLGPEMGFRFPPLG